MKYKKVLAAFIVILVTIAAVAMVIGPEKVMRKLQGSATNLTLDRSAGETKFPVVDEARLTKTQARILALTRQEFETKPDYKKYSEGAHESWCADFVSWIMKEADVPLKNPNSGSWRIPGTYTLHDYYKSIGTFNDASSGYTPKLGDVAIYRNSPIFGDHTNIVLKNENGVLTTIGGNENGTLRIYVNTQKNYSGLLGYGAL